MSLYVSVLIFAGKYIDDFKFVEGKELKFGKVLEFDGVSVDQCAKLCIEEESVNCRSFAYCGNYTKCKLISSTPKQQGSGSLMPSEFCSLYISMHQSNPLNCTCVGIINKCFFFKHAIHSSFIL